MVVKELLLPRHADADFHLLEDYTYNLQKVLAFWKIFVEIIAMYDLYLLYINIILGAYGRV